MASEEKEFFKCTVNAEQKKKIEELAELMGLSPTRMASELLQAGLQDNETVIRLVRSWTGKRVTAVVEAFSEKVKTVRKATGGSR